MAVEPVTIEGRIVDQGGRPILGSVVAILSAELVDVSDPAEPVRIYPTKMTADSDADGHFSIQLIPTIADNLQGRGNYYTIKIKVGPANVGRTIQVYKVAVDAANGPVQQFSDLLPVNNTVITYPMRGPQGELGPPGEEGPQGEPGEAGSGDLSYTHTQDVALDTWSVTHNLGKHPAVTVVDSAGSEVEGDVRYTSSDQCVLTFSAAFSGKAYFN